MDHARAPLAALVAVLLAGTACSPRPAAKASAIELPKAALENGRAAFDIDIPPDCELTTDGIKLDFQTFRVSCGGVQYAGLYAGNFADRSVPRSRLLPAPYSWPSEVQVWSLEVPRDQARADKIAASVRIRTSR